MIGNDGHWRAYATGDAAAATTASFGMDDSYTNVMSTKDLTKVREVWVTSPLTPVSKARAKLRW